jgi:carbon-monoxide dehydrogenase medium subunit
VLAGGQSLVPLMNLRLAFPGVLVDVNGIRELDGVSVNGSVEIGAISRQIAVERSVAATAPLVAEALRHVGHPAIRSRGTFGGTVAHADPAAEIPAVLLALGGEVVARGPGGERAIPADDLFVTHFTTALEADEILTRVRIPRAGAGLRWGFAEVARRQGDFALAGVAATAEVDADGVCRSARIALFGVADRPVRAGASEAALVGRRLDDAGALREAEGVAADGLEPRNDVHASSRYRKEVVGVLVRRALGQAAAR